MFGIAAYVESDFTYIDEFQPEVWYENGDGPWALEFDSRGCLWVGGDVFRLDDEQPYRWARGFTRLCQDDHTPPTTPTGLIAAVAGSQVALSWEPSTDDRGVVGYEVYRDGELVTTVTAPSAFVVSGEDGEHTYRVRAFDARGNRSATSEPVTVTAGPGDGDDGFVCVVTDNGDGSVTVSWNDIGANGYDVIGEGRAAVWRSAISHLDLWPAASYQIVAWGGGVSGTSASCVTPDGVGGAGPDFACSVADNGDGSVTVSWNDIGANGYDVIGEGAGAVWRTGTTHVDPSPKPSYEIVAWGNGLGGTSTVCAQ